MMTVPDGTTHILVVDSQGELVRRVEQLWAEGPVCVAHERKLDRTVDRFREQCFDLMLVTSGVFETGNEDGAELLEIISGRSPRTQILFLARPEAVAAAMTALAAGAFHYAKEPIPDEELRLLMRTALQRRPAYGENALLTKRSGGGRFEKLLGKSGPMRQVYRQVRQAAATDIPVLVVGETGTGKDLVAQAIHRRSHRSAGPWVPVNLGAIPTELVASELFGHEKGAFTGASKAHQGKFEQADGGTIFLDEIDMVDQRVQVALLRLIETQEYQRLGASRFTKTRARIIAACNQDLEAAVADGRFREDLYYRLDVFRLELPPLRDRGDDLELLLERFVHRYNREFRKGIRHVSPQCVEMMRGHRWPGNVRELRNAVQRAVLACSGDTLLPEHFHRRLRRRAHQDAAPATPAGASLEAAERDAIIRALDLTAQNKKKAAELLGISRRGLYRKLERLGIG